MSRRLAAGQGVELRDEGSGLPGSPVTPVDSLVRLGQPLGRT
jgi:hypothetical protein